MDFDLALRIEKSTSQTNSNTFEERKNYKKWDHSNRMSHFFVYSEVNLVSVPTNSWWLNSCATTFISVSMKSSISYRKLIDSERWIYVRYGKSVGWKLYGILDYYYYYYYYYAPVFIWIWKTLLLCHHLDKIWF